VQAVAPDTASIPNVFKRPIADVALNSHDAATAGVEMFRMLKLSPPHGWQAVCWELGIVTAGVLIALGAGEIVQSLNWREQVGEARRAMDTQLLDSKFAAMERIQDSKCLARQLDRLDTLLAEDTMPEVDLRSLQTVRLWPTSSWEAASASGAIARMEQDKRSTYAQIFHFTNVLGSMNRQEYDVGASVRSLERHRDITETSRDRLAQDISRLRSLNYTLTLAARQWLNLAEPLNLKLDNARLNVLQKQVPCRMLDETAKA
jgi:hypothetical protein